ncbi:MAG: adenosylmethionine decarboxylase [Rhodothalassiaceae bacterium]
MSATPPQLTIVPDEPALDHFVQQDGVEFAGRHVIADFWGAHHLDDLALVEQALRRAAEEAGATVLSVDLHHFTPNNGVSGVAVLAESHISIHTWPERGFAALDVFMCGDAKPMAAIHVLREALAPAQVAVNEQKRGVCL